MDHLSLYKTVLKTNCKCKSAVTRYLEIEKQEKPAEGSGQGGRWRGREGGGEGERDVEREGGRWDLLYVLTVTLLHMIMTVS